ncbi:MAG: rubredoxin [Clostridia bacterium]
MDIKELTYGQIEAIFSNLAIGCEKQYNEKEAELFSLLAKYYLNKDDNLDGNIDDIKKNILEEMSVLYTDAKAEADIINDRGSKRALTWTEKVTMLTNVLIDRYKREGDNFLDGTKIYVCEICGFIYVGDEKPEICPICKVPNEKIHEIL